MGLNSAFKVLLYYKISYNHAFLLLQDAALLTETYVDRPIKYKHILIVITYIYVFF
jgi:hypothetical protein